MSSITKAITNAVMQKTAEYDKNSLSFAIQNTSSEEELKSAIERKIKEYTDSGRLRTDKGLLALDYAMIGPHTKPMGSSILAMGSKAINSVFPGTVPDYKMRAGVSTAGWEGKDLIDFTNLSPEYMEKAYPGVGDRVLDAIIAHEILEAEAMDKHMDGITNVLAPARAGGALLGLIAAAAPAAAAVAAYKKGKLTGSDVAEALHRGLVGFGTGAGLGAMAGTAYNYLRGIPAGDGWSSHMSADIPRLESNMIAGLKDEGLSEVFKSLRTLTNERRAIQDGAMKDYGHVIPESDLEAIQKINPNLDY